MRFNSAFKGLNVQSITFSYVSPSENLVADTQNEFQYNF